MICLGDGEELRLGKDLVSALGIADDVTFTGHLPELDTTHYYMEASMMVLPTRFEGFSMTIFQAVAAGLPVLTTKINAAADYLREPEHCLWIPSEDPEEMAERILELIAHPEMRDAMSAVGREYAKTFGAERVVDEYLDVYRSISCSRSSAP